MRNVGALDFVLENKDARKLQKRWLL